MPNGAITGYIDVAQIVLYAFWLFFAGLIFYLRREDKREGYPLESERSHLVRVEGLPRTPRPKIFRLPGGRIQTAPRVEEREVVAGTPIAPWPGAPLEPTGNPMVDGVGPAAYARRHDVPDLTFEGERRIVPMRIASDFFLDPRDADPRGMAMLGADRKVAGMIVDLWVDRGEPQIRYLEVELAGAQARRVLFPVTFARINRSRGEVRTDAIFSDQFAAIPLLKDPDEVTLLEEDKVTGYVAGGDLYAEPQRLWPAL